MTFDAVLTQIRELLHRQGRVSYRALKLRCGIDDNYIDMYRDMAMTFWLPETETALVAVEKR
jgi:hypothetical protein